MPKACCACCSGEPTKRPELWRHERESDERYQRRLDALKASGWPMDELVTDRQLLALNRASWLLHEAERGG